MVLVYQPRQSAEACVTRRGKTTQMLKVSNYGLCLSATIECGSTLETKEDHANDEGEQLVCLSATIGCGSMLNETREDLTEDAGEQLVCLSATTGCGSTL